MSGMAEVLHGLRVPRGGKADGFMFIDANAAHAIADALTAAGFGPVKEAGAVALEEAADVLKPSGVLWWGTSGVTVAEGASGPPTVTLDGWLRARAAAVRGEA